MQRFWASCPRVKAEGCLKVGADHPSPLYASVQASIQGRAAWCLMYAEIICMQRGSSASYGSRQLDGANVMCMTFICAGNSGQHCTATLDQAAS